MVKLQFKSCFLVLLLIAINITCIPPLYCQVAEESDCMDLVKQAYEKRNFPPQSDNQDHVYYLGYQIKTIFREKRQIPHHISDVKVFINQKQTHFISNEMSIYQDESSSFTVIPDRKVIYWGGSSMNMAKEIRLKNFSLLQDKLLDLAKVQECNDIRLENSKANKQVILLLEEEAQKSFPYDRVTFLIDTAEQYIHQVFLDYPEPNKISRIEVTFNEMSYNYQTHILDKPLISLFFNEKGELLPEYKDYQLIDQRKQSKK